MWQTLLSRIKCRSATFWLFYEWNQNRYRLGYLRQKFCLQTNVLVLDYIFNLMQRDFYFCIYCIYNLTVYSYFWSDLICRNDYVFHRKILRYVYDSIYCDKILLYVLFYGNNLCVLVRILTLILSDRMIELSIGSGLLHWSCLCILLFCFRCWTYEGYFPI